jgi:hypothetical protein
MTSAPPLAILPPRRRPAVPRRAAERGSLLVVAMILTVVIGISLASYIQLGKTSLKISNRALYNNAAMNLAENGLEEAMYSINRKVANSTYSWSDDGWTPLTSPANAARRRWRNIRFDQAASGEAGDPNLARGEVRVIVYNYDGTGSPRIVARSLITLGEGFESGGAIEKWVSVQVRRTSKFANGLVAKETITFSGNNATVDSWNSDPDNDPSTAAIKFSNAVRKDNGTVGSISVSVNSVAVQNADIFGFAATGGALPTVGAQGRVGTFTTPVGTMDMSRVSTDFTANFDPVPQPTGGTPLGNIGPMTLGAATTTTVYSGTKVVLSGGPGSNLVIKGNVTLYLTGSDAISVTGNGGIVIEPGASLSIYAAGSIKIGGNGVLNGGNTTASANQPINFQLWGTSTDTATKQDIQVAGNGVLSGIVYAPNGSVKINGNGDVMGSVVANDITVVGNAAFHYDESLGNFGGGNPFRVTRWNELTTPADKSPYLTDLDFPPSSP